MTAEEGIYAPPRVAVSLNFLTGYIADRQKELAWNSEDAKQQELTQTEQMARDAALDTIRQYVSGELRCEEEGLLDRALPIPMDIWNKGADEIERYIVEVHSVADED